MSDSIPRYLLAPPGTDSDSLASRLGRLPLRTLHSVSHLLDGDALAPGWVFVAPGTSAETVMELLSRLGAGGEAEWSPILLVEEGGALHALPLSPGYREPLEMVLERMAAPAGAPAALSLRHAIRILSGVRHDINNVLTVGLAESQLLQMELEPGSEAAESVSLLEAQFQRIREMMAELGAARSPRR